MFSSFAVALHFTNFSQTFDVSPKSLPCQMQLVPACSKLGPFYSAEDTPLLVTVLPEASVPVTLYVMLHCSAEPIEVSVTRAFKS
jgi:hypothetical protein